MQKYFGGKEDARNILEGMGTQGIFWREWGFKKHFRGNGDARNIFEGMRM
jgi:hypothetical protein